MKTLFDILAWWPRRLARPFAHSWAVPVYDPASRALRPFCLQGLVTMACAPLLMLALALVLAVLP